MKEIRKENRWLVHVLFILLVVLCLYGGTLILQAQGFKLGNRAMLSARYLFFIGCLYTGRWICQLWFSRNRLLVLGIYLILAYCLINIVWWLIVKYILGIVQAGFWEVVFSASPFYVVGLVIGFLLTLIRFLTTLQLNQARSAVAQKQHELHLLQSQLSPHFLFNTLNNLYGISLTQHSRVPKLLLQLSDLLRYAVYETKNEFVQIEDEIRYIHNFIGFEKIRISDRLVLDLQIEDLTGSGIRIAPMLFIVFIENAFKHARDTLDLKIYIAVKLYIEDKQVVFVVQNSFGGSAREGAGKEHAGLGLANTIRRLELLYPGQYKLKQTIADQQYFVELRLPILIQ